MKKGRSIRIYRYHLIFIPLCKPVNLFFLMRGTCSLDFSNSISRFQNFSKLFSSSTISTKSIHLLYSTFQPLSNELLVKVHLLIDSRHPFKHISLNAQDPLHFYFIFTQPQSNFVNMRIKTKFTMKRADIELIARGGDSEEHRAKITKFMGWCIFNFNPFVLAQSSFILLTFVFLVDQAAAPVTTFNEIKAIRTEVAAVEATRIEAVRIEAVRVEAARLEAVKIESAKVKAEKLEADKAKSRRLEAARVQAKAAKAEALRLLARRTTTEKKARTAEISASPFAFSIPSKLAQIRPRIIRTIPSKRTPFKPKQLFSAGRPRVMAIESQYRNGFKVLADPIRTLITTKNLSVLVPVHPMNMIAEFERVFGPGSCFFNTLILSLIGLIDITSVLVFGIGWCLPDATKAYHRDGGPSERWIKKFKKSCSANGIGFVLTVSSHNFWCLSLVFS